MIYSPSWSFKSERLAFVFSGGRKNSVWTTLFFKIYDFVFQRGKRDMQDWDGIRRVKDDNNIHVLVNFSSNWNNLN